MKIKILDDMLAKGYISQEEHQKRLSDECFSEYDAAAYRHVAKAYAEADNSSYPIEYFRKKYAKWLS